MLRYKTNKHGMPVYRTESEMTRTQTTESFKLEDIFSNVLKDAAKTAPTFKPNEGGEDVVKDIRRKRRKDRRDKLSTPIGASFNERHHSHSFCLCSLCRIARNKLKKEIN